MKSEFTVTAKSVEEAYSKAIELYSSLGEISYEIVQKEKKGFLGIFGRSDAVIKVTVDDGREEKKPKAQPQGEAKVNENKKNNQNNNQNKNQNQGKSNQAQKPVQQKPVQQKPSQTKQEKPRAVQNDEKPKAEAKKVEEKVQIEAPLKEENVNVTVGEKTLAMDFLKSFIKDIGFNCEVKGDMTLNENGFVSRLITIEGEDAPSLIGHRGDMLDALQYLANLCLARKSEGEHKEYVKVVLDIENYREKREQALRALARRMAEKALKYQRNVLLEPMNPYERMIIHSEIQGIEGVSTHSVGYDDNRKIVITCENKRRKPYNKDN